MIHLFFAISIFTLCFFGYAKIEIGISPERYTIREILREFKGHSLLPRSSHHSEQSLCVMIFFCWVEFFVDERSVNRYNGNEERGDEHDNAIHVAREEYVHVSPVAD